MRLFFCFCLMAILLQSCGFKEREQTITRKEKEIEVLEAELLSKEQQLAEKEKALLVRELALDSTVKNADSVSYYDPRIVGKWSVKMKCTETNCEGSAIGDIKVEQWEISYNDTQTVTVKAYTDKVLTRIYSGSNSKDGLRLTHENSINISLSLTGKDKMEGKREITQRDCKIVYSLVADRIL